MSFRQLFKCISCTKDSKNESKIESSFSYSAVNETSEITFDEINEEENNDLNGSGLSKSQVNDILEQIWNQYVDSKKSTYEKELNLRMFIHPSSGKVFRWKQYTNEGDRPETGRSLWILLYGSDQSSDDLDLKLNENGSIWLIPSCSTDWQQEYIDSMFDRLIEYNIIVNEVNPNRIFLFGMSSSGGDGVYQIISRISDRWAAAGVINGNPRDLSPLSLRNLPFALHMSQENTTELNQRAAWTWGERLQQCSKEHVSGGYQYWMQIGQVKQQKQDALAWMNKYTRNPWPKRIVWHYQDFHIPKRFYWISLPSPEQFLKGQTIRIEVRYRHKIFLEQIPKEIRALVLRLSDQLVNLDQAISVYFEEEIPKARIFHGIIPRTQSAIEQSIQERADPLSAATAILHVIRDSNGSTMSCHLPTDEESQSQCSICSISNNDIQTNID